MVDTATEFETFFLSVEPRLRAALTATYGVDHGREAAAEALAWAWEHWGRVRLMEHPIAYLYRVGQSRSRRIRRETPAFPSVPVHEVVDVDPRLPVALAGLTRPQRVAVLLVHGHDWSHNEVSELLGVATSTVATHLSRGMQRLRSLLASIHR